MVTPRHAGIYRFFSLYPACWGLCRRGLVFHFQVYGFKAATLSELCSGRFPLLLYGCSYFPFWRDPFAQQELFSSNP